MCRSSVVSPEKDSKRRFRAEYRKLNNMMVGNTYRLPRMDEYIASPGKAKVLKTLSA